MNTPHIENEKEDAAELCPICGDTTCIHMVDRSKFECRSPACNNRHSDVDDILCRECRPDDQSSESSISFVEVDQHNEACMRISLDYKSGHLFMSKDIWDAFRERAWPELVSDLSDKEQKRHMEYAEDIRKEKKENKKLLLDSNNTMEHLWTIVDIVTGLPRHGNLLDRAKEVTVAIIDLVKKTPEDKPSMAYTSDAGTSIAVGDLSQISLTTDCCEPMRWDKTKQISLVDGKTYDVTDRADKILEVIRGYLTQVEKDLTWHRNQSDRRGARAAGDHRYAVNQVLIRIQEAGLFES